MPITGRCHCGYIRYEVEGPVIKCSYCDCDGCKKATGALKAPFVTVGKAGFKTTAGEVATFKAQTGDRCDAHGAWHFCQKCGSPIYWANDDSDQMDLFAGSLDYTALFQINE